MLRTLKILFLSVIIVFVFLSLYHAGTWLIRHDKIEKSDAILVLSGSLADRVLQAADLYHQGYAPHIYIVENDQSAYKLLQKHGVRITSGIKEYRNALEQLGVPPGSITIIACGAKSTAMEAQAMRSYIQKNSNIRKLIIVSSPDHTRRASIIFRKAFRHGKLPTKIFMSPSVYSSYTGKHWFKDREDIQIVINEYLKLFSFLIFEQWDV